MNLSAGKKNLAQISKVLTQIMNGSEFGDDKPSYVPINDFVRKAIQQITAWLIEGKSVSHPCFHSVLTGYLVASVPDAESQFHAHEFLDATVQPKPIYISPNEIYTIHSLLLQHQNFLVRSLFCLVFYFLKTKSVNRS
jgi:Ras GTPase-activating-like protein IQGAP2/3